MNFNIKKKYASSILSKASCIHRLRDGKESQHFHHNIACPEGFFSVQYSLQINMQLSMFFPTISTKTPNGYPFSEFPLFS